MKYHPALDGIRAIAAVCVVLFHCRGDETGFVFGSGFLGVDVFFVLSGYLITTQLREGRTLKEFYWRRALRLLPALLLFLAVYLVLAPWLWPGLPHTRDALLAGLYVSDLTMAFLHSPELLQHTWSLAAEAKFYALWPLVFLLVRERPLPALIALYLVLTGSRLLTVEWGHAYYRPDTHGTGMVLGAMLAYVTFRARWMAWAGAMLVLLALMAAKWNDQFTLDYLITLTEIGAGLLILGVLEGGGVARLLAMEPLRWLGLMSYGIYLWHYPIARLVRDHLDSYSAATLTLIASTLFAALSFYTLERIRDVARRPVTAG